MRLSKTVVNWQRTEEDLVFIGLRELRMDEKYTELEMKESVFYWKMRAQQEAMLKKFHNLPVKTDDLLPIDLDESNSESAEITTPLNVQLDNCGFICVPFSI